MPKEKRIEPERCDNWELYWYEGNCRATEQGVEGLPMKLIGVIDGRRLWQCPQCKAIKVI